MLEGLEKPSDHDKIEVMTLLLKRMEELSAASTQLELMAALTASAATQNLAIAMLLSDTLKEIPSPAQADDPAQLQLFQDPVDADD